MKIKPELLTLYAVTDRSWLNGRTLSEVTRETIEGGVTIVQIREKNMDTEQFIKEAKELKKLTDSYGIPLIINDNIEVCLACNAAGVHVGQSDLAVSKVRELLGEDKIIGVTAKTVEQALAAQEGGADYLGCGAVFGSTTKLDTKKMSLETLDDICSHVSIPVVAIGGIDAKNMPQLSGHKMNGAAVVSALYASENPKESAQKLRKMMDEFAVK